MGESVLITGGLGYVGGRLACHLYSVRPDLEIILTTRRSKESLPKWSGKFCVKQMDLLDPASIESCIKGVGTVVHLAALNEIDSMKNPLRALDVNVGAVYNMLHASCAAGVRRFIYLSTFHVYSPHNGKKIAENSPTRSQHPYAITHLAAEGMVDYFGRYKGLDALILRLSNSYGYPMDPSVNRWTLIFNDLCRQVVKTGKIILRSSGEQHRDFISLEDVARAIDYFLFVKPHVWGDGLFNLGGECSMSIFDVANRVASVFQRICGVELIPIEVGKCNDSTNSAYPVNYSINKLKSTGFSLTGNMDKEIEKTINVAKMISHDGSGEKCHSRMIIAGIHV